ncbi:MAG TPA: hypothetical protein VFP72_23355, partial [Kineosporiaceae bacterium]|nr:hypothetical protein [Kineosporiaceae bacterium]
MAWLVAQSLPVLATTFVLGLVVGWLWWGRARRRVPLGESAAVREVSRRYEVAVAERDARIALLEHDREPTMPPTGDSTGTITPAAPAA